MPTQPSYGPTTHYPRPRGRGLGRRVVLVLVVVAVACACWLWSGTRWQHQTGHTTAAGTSLTAPDGVLPGSGQAAYVLDGDSGDGDSGDGGRGSGAIRANAQPEVVPIASVAKVMTAYLVLRHDPLDADSDGPTFVLTADDVADTDRRRARGESLVPVAEGEQLSERQALEALLLPSANNIAVVLAKWISGSQDAFVAEMNDTARKLGMTSTHYTDPSGMDANTVSTAADQVRLFRKAMTIGAFASLVSEASATIPVAGIVHSTDSLLGHDGFIGGKTGSHDAAGGCFVFQAVRQTGDGTVTITGAVLGQRQGSYIDAALRAAAGLVDRAAAGGSSPAVARITR